MAELAEVPVEEVLARIEEDHLVRLAQQMVRIPSPSGEERDLARYLAGYLDAAGLRSRIHPVAVGERQSEQVTGTLPGSGGGRSLMLCGHLDTARWESDVYRRDLWTVGPYEGLVRDGKL